MLQTLMYDPDERGTGGFPEKGTFALITIVGQELIEKWEPHSRQ